MEHEQLECFVGEGWNMNSWSVLLEKGWNMNSWSVLLEKGWNMNSWSVLLTIVCLFGGFFLLDFVLLDLSVGDNVLKARSGQT